MANFNSIETTNDTNLWGQNILRAKTTLIKPYSKVKRIPKKQKSLFDFI